VIRKTTRIIRQRLIGIRGQDQKSEVRIKGQGQWSKVGVRVRVANEQESRINGYQEYYLPTSAF
jgi:hypothetical protein